MSTASVLWRTRPLRHSRDAPALNILVQQLYPGAPEIKREHAQRLCAVTGEQKIYGDDGSMLTLTRSSAKATWQGVFNEVLVSFAPGDCGLGEFDLIAESLAHSAPVAVAIRAIRHEESRLPPLLTPADRDNRWHSLQLKAG